MPDKQPAYQATTQQHTTAQAAALPAQAAALPAQAAAQLARADQAADLAAAQATHAAAQATQAAAQATAQAAHHGYIMYWHMSKGRIVPTRERTAGNETRKARFPFNLTLT